jgi:uncharacterized protein YyaL (SSP411 family)
MSCKHTNQLIHETSPYLLQHAHNPVHWYAWGEEALTLAKKLDKPILVSIGYAACHWCHVMERESFEDEATAKLMNDCFINIKIDREERPDLDYIYMDAVQAMSGSGGWPLNVFLTPDTRPFYGGTYFPPVAAFNRMSWSDVLTNVHKAYRERKHEIEAQADNLLEHIKSSNSFGIEDNLPKDDFFTKENVDLIASNILKQADKKWGGFGKAPKFPQVFSIQYLLRHYHFTKDENALEQALLSLDKMTQGGIYDHIGGGFARYSTDEKWFAPHFEKMLYDNALVIGVLSEAYQLTKKEKYAETIKHTMQFIQREMMGKEGGFYSALDADSEGIEGKFYTWSKNDIEKILHDDALLYCELYNISEEGNWEHDSIVWMTTSMESFAEQKEIDVEDLKTKMSLCHTKLLSQRNKRIRPMTDDKILLGWNALMNTACSKAYAAIGDEAYKQFAIDNMFFLEQSMQNEKGNWLHTFKDGHAKISAFLDDYAYLIEAYIHLQEITGDASYLTKSKQVTEYVIEHFKEDTSGYFFYTNKDQTDAIVRKKEVYDGATPSGNAIMANNLLYLSIVFDIKLWDDWAKKIIRPLKKTIFNYPTSFGIWAGLVQKVFFGTKEIIIIGENATQTLPKLLELYRPNKILQSSNAENECFPLLRGKYPPSGVLFYLCNDYICETAVDSLSSFLAKV